VQMTSPYHNVYLNSVIRMSSFNIILTGQVASNALLILFVSRWGGAIDRYGNRPVLLISTFLSALFPLMWLRVNGAGPGTWWLIFFSNAWSGATYCAVDLTLQNLFMGQAKEKNRSMYFAVYFLFTQLCGLALGSLMGGTLLDNVLSRVEPLNITIAGAPFTRYNALFLLGGLLRLGVVFFLLKRLKEDGSEKVEVMIQGVKNQVVYSMHSIRATVMRKHLRRQLDKERQCDQEENNN
jgi:Major Facilitator Superfamily.